MTVLEQMKQQALAEFDEMVAARSRDTRFVMKAAGASEFEIEAYLEACQPGLAEQRAGIGLMVTVALMKAGVPLGVKHNVCS